MGKFVIKETKSGGMKFDLKADNGQILVMSEDYASKSGLKGGIESVRNNCLAPVEDQTEDGYEKLRSPKFEVYTDKSGKFRFRLKAKNGQIIAVCEKGYMTVKSCLNGISSVGRHAPDAPIIEE